MEIKELVDRIGTNVKVVCKYFNVSFEELSKICSKDNLAVFSNYRTFFFWLHEGKSEYELLQSYLDNGDLEPDSTQYIKLPDGTVVFMYM